MVRSQQGKGVLLEFKQLGCYGWQFVPTIQKVVSPHLVAYAFEAFTLWLEPSQIEKIKGTLIDCEKDDLLQYKVVFNHPLARQHCGCGESFVIDDE
jgi:Fe-S cluster assembly iron-binding protein IscA